MIQIQTNILGTFAIKNGKVIEKILFDENLNEREIAKKIILSRNNLIDEEISLINKINSDEFKVLNKEKFEKIKDKKFYKLEISEVLPIHKIAEQVGIYNIEEKVYKINLEIVKEEMRNLGKENLAIQYIRQIDEIDKTINLMNELLREIYGYHFPELEDIVEDNLIFAKIVSYGSRNEILKNIDNMDLQENLKNEIKFKCENSFGTDFDEKDLNGIKEYAKEILNLYNTRKILDENLKILMNEIMPNVTYLLGHLIAARLLSYAGSLKRLSELPSSTIQLLGAEKALFKFLRNRKNPPKYGVIFNVPEIRNAKKKAGRIARHLAAKISIASKVDYFKGNFIGDKLKEEFLNFVKRNK
ncbi:MAG: hypothetical protein ACK4YO_02400 [Candidatus Altarchaeaceae archaeon]